MLPGVLALAASAASGQTPPLSSSLSIQETLTNNVNLAPSATAKGDLVTQLTPGISISEVAARSRLNGTVSLPVLLYARTGTENNKVYAQANLSGNVEAVEKFFFIDGAVNISQQYLTPLGAQPPGLTNATQNRYTTASYSASPYIQGGTRGAFQYSLRDDNIWSTLNSTPVSVNNSYTNQLVATAGRQTDQLGWLAEYDRTSVHFNSQAPQLSRLARLTAFHSPDPQLQLSADAGYEDNDYTLSHSRDAIYGVGARWRPTDRTTVDARWEHRFFGSSYLFNFDNHTRLSAWGLSASRTITSYPQQVASLPGLDLQSLLNQLFLSSIPDPAQRQTFINQYLLEHGLPPSGLVNPVNVYTQQITLVEQATASVGLLGARNSIVFSGYYLRQRPISAAGTALPGIINPGSNTTQEGISVAWSHSLSPSLAFSLSGNASRTVSNVPQGELGSTAATRQGYIIATLTSPLSASTQVNGGARYQVLRGDPTFESGYTEAAVFIGLSHQFH